MNFLKNKYNRIIIRICLIVYRPILVYILMIIFYLILSLYFFADPILCQGDEITEVKELMDCTVPSKSGSAESLYTKQENLEGNGSEVSDKTLGVIPVEESLDELNVLGESDLKECKIAHMEFNY